MKKSLSLVEMATYGYASTREKKGSWLEQAFGKGENHECVKRSDKDKE